MRPALVITNDVRRCLRFGGTSIVVASCVAVSICTAPSVGDSRDSHPFAGRLSGCLFAPPKLGKWWEWQDSHPRRVVCKTTALLLSYTPEIGQVFIHGSFSGYCHVWWAT